eukprot:Plantae.Rhodophyta-Hildenbrandia_rubra.ctg5634.p1 GENE.Plantae.Rhodophyta-Hildenbrandia_rubra.ctg5634~~Plantae.Rhodophyta-Hildenbrandia_rubra.ctg5634.p1  ORF type:complete len:292 (-),score=76.85 Plantae.Rhodophyta-Hildenbrandia_rubra.ctg5634:437-1312(-)
MADELFELRNYFYLGNYSAAVTEGDTVSLDTGKDRIERDVIMARIQIARGEHSKVLTSVTDDSPTALQAVRLLAKYNNDNSSKDEVLSALTNLLEDDVSKDNATVLTIGAIIYAAVEDYDNALRTAAKGNDLEHMSIMVQILLQMDRADAAKKKVSAMREIDEDATLSQLAAAWVHLAEGGEDVQEAVYIYQDLLERHGATDPILNGMALCHLSMGKYDEAEKVLQEALTKNKNFAATLANSVVCSKHKNKQAELVQRYVAQLRTVSPGDAWLKDVEAKAAEFDQLAAAMG